MNYQFVILGVFITFALIEVYRYGFFKKGGEVRDDSRVELIGSIVLLVITQPLVLFMGAALAGFIAPEYQNALVGSSIFFHLALLLIFDDMMQYWWHRLSHTTRFMYNLHRAHHNGKYMSVRIVFRNNIFYYLFMPSYLVLRHVDLFGFGLDLRFLCSRKTDGDHGGPFRMEMGSCIIFKANASSHCVGRRTCYFYSINA